MVAYSFKKQFGPPILAGTKAQTIRADRKRHARPGEELQLYTGMRTKHCRLVARVPCIAVEPVRLVFSRRGPSELFEIAGTPLSPRKMIRFAHADGFDSLDAMNRCWWAEHPPEEGDTLDFTGVVICWTPLAPADALDIGAAA
ncbi:ASCH domain-containing protein [Methylobacterium goesingense]|uniref:ASCH domain-containing protein n=1 Tax=Methylobacterium goesingense TaxID=243690 RepID=A0ABV2L493_9HYPH|nr:hypothetical protein [Methylobacterium goesingense]GJD72603.1 hypothetical protein CFIICLFH_0820 [Methylobacterium goesingense]